MNEENKKEIEPLKSFKVGPGTQVKYEQEERRDKELSDHIHKILTNTAEILKPEGFTQQGYAIVFLYDKVGIISSSLQAQYICKANFKDDVMEQLASGAIEALANKCKSLYGRMPNRKRT